MGRGRKEIAKDGEKTRFGQPGGPDPKKATKSGCPKHSIRQAVQYFSRKTAKDINELGKQNEPTMSQIVAVVAWKQGAKGNVKAIEFLTNNVDGKLPQETQLTGKDGEALQAPVIYLPANGRENNEKK
jgi:hypothetical protein